MPAVTQINAEEYAVGTSGAAVALPYVLRKKARNRLFQNFVNITQMFAGEFSNYFKNMYKITRNSIDQGLRCMVS